MRGVVGMVLVAMLGGCDESGFVAVEAVDARAPGPDGFVFDDGDLKGGAPSPADLGGPLAFSCPPGAPVQAGAPWPTYRRCPGHLGRSPAVGPATPRLAWTFPVGGQNVAPPILLADGTVVAGAADGAVYAVDGSTGALRWKYAESPPGAPIEASAAVGADGTIYVATIRDLMALDGATGQRRWSTPIAGNNHEAPLLGPGGASGTIYIGGDNLYAVDAASGAARAYDALPTLGWFGSAVDGRGRVYVAAEGVLLALDAAFQFVWSYAESGPCEAALGEQGTLYLGAGRNVIALDDSGKMQWSQKIPAYASVPAIAADGTVIVGVFDYNKSGMTDGSLVALDGATGATRWTFPLGGHWFRSPSIGGDGTVYIASSDTGTLYALDGSTGAERWSLDADVTTDVAIGADGTLYAGASAGIIAVGR